MANDLLITQKVANMALAEFVTNNSLLMTASRTYEGELTDREYQYGDSLQVRRRNHFVVNSGRVNTGQDVLETSENITVDQWHNVAMNFTGKELTLDTPQQEEMFNERYVAPAVQELVNKMETTIAAGGVNQLYNAVGTPGTPINSFSVVRETRTKMLELDMPVVSDPTYMALGPRDAGSLQSALQNSFNDTLNQDISMDARLGRLSKFDIYENQSIQRHTAGDGAGSPVINGAVASGNTINVSGLTASVGTILAGDVITVAGVNSLSPIGRRDIGQLAQFVVTSGGTADGGGNLAITVADSIISDVNNPNRNVSQALPNGAAITVLGAGSTYNVNLAYCKRGLDIIVPPLAQLDLAGRNSTVRDPETGVALTVSRQGDIVNYVNQFRIDILWGYKWHPQYAVKLVS